MARLDPTLLNENAVFGLAGLKLVSDIPLGGLLLPYEGAEHSESVHIRLSDLPERLSSSLNTLEDVEFDGRQLLLNVPGVARYLVRDGNEILVEPAPSADTNDVRAFLLGMAFSALCHQRGFTPLHALMIDVPGGSIGFIGPSRAGKSTLGLALTRRGYQVIADDVCYIQNHGTEGLEVLPGIFRIRLWEDTVKAFDLWQSGVKREFRSYKKYLIPVEAPANPCSPRKLLRMYRLEPAQTGTDPTITRTQGANSLELLMRSVYGLPIAENMGRKSDIFSTCASLARDVPIFEFRRPMGFARLKESVLTLEKHFLETDLT